MKIFLKCTKIYRKANKKHIKLSYSIYNISNGQKNKHCNKTSYSNALIVRVIETIMVIETFKVKIIV